MDREAIYKYLNKLFYSFERELSLEQRTDLDGLLWKASQQLAIFNNSKKENTCVPAPAEV